MNTINDIAHNPEHGEQQRKGSFLQLAGNIEDSISKVIRAHFDNGTFISSKMAAIDMAKVMGDTDLAQEMQDDLTEILEGEVLNGMPFKENQFKS